MMSILQKKMNNFIMIFIINLVLICIILYLSLANCLLNFYNACDNFFVVSKKFLLRVKMEKNH